jgi:hypothetical protein
MLGRFNTAWFAQRYFVFLAAGGGLEPPVFSFAVFKKHNTLKGKSFAN